MNPFSRNRYEYIPTHLYYLPSGLIEKLEDSKPSYVIGSRGSGKTTLLKALNWGERLENQWLNQELDGDAFRGRFIATYTKLPLVQIPAFKVWLTNANDAVHSSLFGYYLDLVSTQHLAYSLAQLLTTEHFPVPPSLEQESVLAFANDADFLFGGVSEPPASIVECHGHIRRMRRKLESFAIGGFSIEDCLATMMLPVAGEVGASFSSHMARMLDTCPDTSGSERWHFKTCLDEAECLDQRQLVVLNTIVRTSAWPISYVISFVGQPDDLSLTVHDQLTVQTADRSVIHLDDLSRPQFEQLCDGVANVRVKAQLEGLESAEPFTTSSVLGSLNMNELVSELVKQSEGSFAKTLQQLAENFLSSPWLREREHNDHLPYVEAYLADRLSLEPPDPTLPREVRAQASREFRKKFVASYLSICRELGVAKTPYSYSQMVFGISDTCVRDYLSQMYYVFEQSGLSLEQFVGRSVPWRTQNEAIHKASLEKRDSIKTGEEVTNPERVRRLTIALGELTAFLQRGDSNSVGHLRSPERGCFHFSSRVEPGGQNAELYRILKDASDAGFLRLKRDGKIITHFRLHASMAPTFGFSYRGAYYAVGIKKNDVLDMLDSGSDSELSKTARKIADRILSRRDDPDQQTLFPLDDGEL